MKDGFKAFIYVIVLPILLYKAGSLLDMLSPRHKEYFVWFLVILGVAFAILLMVVTYMDDQEFALGLLIMLVCQLLFGFFIYALKG